MRALYREMEGILDRIAFGSLWPGFARLPFALYNQTGVWLPGDRILPHDNRFLGNTAITFEGNQVAIWQVPDPEHEDRDTLAAGLVHEMFHAFQQIRKDLRQPMVLDFLEDSVDVEIFRRRALENKMLAEAYRSTSFSRKRERLERFMAYRKDRVSLFGDAARSEFLSETHEGLAEYIGIRTLERIAPDKARARIEHHLTILTDPGTRLFDVRRMTYTTGAVFALVCEEAGRPVGHDIGAVQETLFELLSADIRPASSDEADPDGEVARLAQSLREERVRAFASFQDSHSQRIEGDFSLAGFDPMNTIRLGDAILGTHFLMLTPAGSNDPLFLQGPVLAELQPGSRTRVRAYLH
jgi:hypothetical protein